MTKFLSEWNNWQLVVALGFVLLCALGGSAVESDYVIQVMVLAAVYAAVGTAWSIAGGLSGLLLLGYISFFGLGAYVDGVFFTKLGLNPWLCIVLGFFFGGSIGLADFAGDTAIWSGRGLLCHVHCCIVTSFKIYTTQLGLCGRCDWHLPNRD